MHHPLSSRVAKNAPPHTEGKISSAEPLFLSFINAPPPEEKCTTKDAPLVRACL
jgi:hypothetical protein